MKRAVVLLSGGLDSATTLAIAKTRFEVYALSFAYGQRHAVEISAAKRVARAVGVQQHRVLKIDLRSFGGSALTDEIAVPKHQDRARSKSITSVAESETHAAPSHKVAREKGTDIPITYVPARNTIFLSYALAWAEVLAARDIFIGANAVDYSGYPDCRPEFIAQFERLANVATKAGVSGDCFHVHAPLIALSKAGIIQRGAALGVDFSLTHSCYDPGDDGRSCGECDSCQIRRAGFAEAGILDPAAKRRS